MNYKTNTMKKILTILALTSVNALAADPANLFPEGNFESDPKLSTEPGKITGDFSLAEEGTLYIEPGDLKTKGVTVEVENEKGSNFIRYNIPTNAGFTGILRTYIVMKVPSSAPATLTVSLRWRLKDFAPQANAPEWASAQVEPAFVVPGSETKTINGALRLKQDSNGEWQEAEASLPVPSGATHLVLCPGIYLGTGTLDLDDVKIFAE